MSEHEPVKIDAGWKLLARARSGSEEAWKSLFEQHSPQLLRMAALLIGSTDAAKDCVQEAFLRVLKGAGRHQNGSFRAYISTIAYRLALKENRRVRRLIPAEGQDATASDPSPLDIAIADEHQREVAQVIRELPAHHREVLVLRFQGEHSYEEIARIAGVPLGTVKSRIFHAVKAARSAMKKRGIG